MTTNLKSRGTCAVCDRYVGTTAIAHLARPHRSWQRNAATGEKEFKKCPGSNKPVIGNEIARQPLGVTDGQQHGLSKTRPRSEVAKY